MFEDKIDALNQARELGSTKKKKKPKAAVKEPEKKVRTHAEKRTYTVDEIQDILNISRTSAYNLTKTGQFRVVKVGGHIRIPCKSFDEWLDGPAANVVLDDEDYE